ncbi:MAG: GAF domain-containing sensor histidine kinase [Candidatus Kerfeldbacteria bacterium]
MARLTDKIFFKAAIEYPVVTKRLTDIINEEIELGDLVKHFTADLEDGLRVEHATILLPVGEELFIEPEELASRQKKASKHRTLSRKSPLIKELLHTDDPIILDELDMQVSNAETPKNRKRYEAIRSHLEEIEGHVAVPVSTKNKLVAVLLLTKKKSGEAFSVRDIQLLEVISPQVASGIEKARLYQEQKEFAITLQREVDKATADLQKANAKLRELDQAKSEFMSIASHQLRTPLAGIIGYLSMIDSGDYGKVPKQQDPVIKDILDATQRLIRMVNVFLNVTRIEAGRFVMNYKMVPFFETIESVYKELKPTAEKHGVNLVIKPSELPEVEVDNDKIKDVILNLIDNAIKYSPNGTVTVWGDQPDGKHISVHVQDTGVGIAKGEAKNLFSKFVRGSGIARVDPSGSGLGLFIAKKITEEHGGKVWAESEGEGKGSIFSFSIPISADKKAQKKAKEFADRARKKDARIEAMKKKNEKKAK